MHAGPAGNKALAAAAEQAGIGAEEASDGVGALVQLLAETAKLNLSEQVQRTSLDSLDSLDRMLRAGWCVRHGF